MRAWARRMAALRVVRDDFPWPHWGIGDQDGTRVLLWPWWPPLPADTDDEGTAL